MTCLVGRLLSELLQSTTVLTVHSIHESCIAFVETVVEPYCFNCWTLLHHEGWRFCFLALFDTASPTGISIREAQGGGCELHVVGGAVNHTSTWKSNQLALILKGFSLVKVKKNIVWTVPVKHLVWLVWECFRVWHLSPPRWLMGSAGFSVSKKPQ